MKKVTTIEIVEYPSGNKWWYLNGKRHREDGPAHTSLTGRKYYDLHGKYLTESEFSKQCKDTL